MGFGIFVNCMCVMCTRLLVNEFVKGCTFGIEYLINSLLLRDLVDEEFGFYLLVFACIVQISSSVNGNF